MPLWRGAAGVRASFAVLVCGDFGRWLGTRRPVPEVLGVTAVFPLELQLALDPGRSVCGARKSLFPMTFSLGLIMAPFPEAGSLDGAGERVEMVGRCDTGLFCPGSVPLDLMGPISA